MGIRYYAYAYDPELVDRAVSHPREFIAPDPLADAWGLIPTEQEGVFSATFVQTAPYDRMLYLDKAWRELQVLTEPNPGDSPRPAYRMFEGQVTHTPWGWEPWCRAILPAEVAAISRDLHELADPEPDFWRGWSAEVEEGEHRPPNFLGKARDFVGGLAETGEGFVYMIG